jgi:hypothetical protein
MAESRCGVSVQTKYVAVSITVNGLTNDMKYSRQHYSMECWTFKVNSYNDRNICKMLTIKRLYKNPVISPYPASG